MSKMIPSKGTELVKVLQKMGFHVERWKGSHAIMDNGHRIVVVPCHGKKELPKGTQRAIIRDAGLDIDEFNQFLKKV